MREYFSHDYNARADRKLRKLIAKHGYLAYGLYWAIVEDLYNNNNELPCDYEVMAFDFRVEAELIESIINGFDLFVVSDGHFGSNSVEKRLNKRAEKSKKARESAMQRWKKSERTEEPSERTPAAPPIPDVTEENPPEKKTDKEDGFSEFWKTYHTVTGKAKTDRDAALKHWRSLSKKEKGYAIENVKAYYDSIDNKKYCKKARTYLADKNFNDEFKPSGSKELTPEQVADFNNRNSARASMKLEMLTIEEYKSKFVEHINA